MPMHQSCGADCDGQLRYMGSSRPSNILSPGFGCGNSRMLYMRGASGTAAAAAESSRSARYAVNGGCGAFSASMAQLASSAQCNSRMKPPHLMGGGNSSGGSHRPWSSSSSTLHCSSPFHGPYVGCGAWAGAGGFPRGFSSLSYGSCGFPGGLTGSAAAAGGLYCSGGILTSAGSSRRGSCCSNVLPPQSHSHQIAKQLEQQQLEMEEAAAGAGGTHLSQGHYQYHDCSKHHGGSESSYSHLLPEKLHEWVEVIKHPRSHATQGTRIALSSLHIGECPGVPENASSFAMKRTGTLKWQPGSVLEEDDDTWSECSSNGSNKRNSSGSNGHNYCGTNSKNSSRSSSKSGNSKNGCGSTGGSSLGLPRKVQYYLSSQDPKGETVGPVAGLLATTGATGEGGGKAGAARCGGCTGACSPTVTAGQAAGVTPSYAPPPGDTEKAGGGRDTAFAGFRTAAAGVGLRPTITKASTGTERSAEETHRGEACKGRGGQAEKNEEKEGEWIKKKKLGFTKRTSPPRKASGNAHLQRYQQKGNAKEDGWAATGATCCTADADGDGTTTAAGCGNSSGGSGGESDNSGPVIMVSPPPDSSTHGSLSGRESDCSGSPRRRNTEPAVDDAAQAAGNGGFEVKKNFSWHKLRQKLKL